MGLSTYIIGVGSTAQQVKATKQVGLESDLQNALDYLQDILSDVPATKAEHSQITEAFHRWAHGDLRKLNIDEQREKAEAIRKLTAFILSNDKIKDQFFMQILDRQSIPDALNRLGESLDQSTRDVGAAATMPTLTIRSKSITDEHRGLSSIGALASRLQLSSKALKSATDIIGKINQAPTQSAAAATGAAQANEIVITVPRKPGSNYTPVGKDAPASMWNYLCCFPWKRVAIKVTKGSLDTQEEIVQARGNLADTIDTCDNTIVYASVLSTIAVGVFQALRLAVSDSPALNIVTIAFPALMMLITAGAKHHRDEAAAMAKETEINEQALGFTPVVVKSAATG